MPDSVPRVEFGAILAGGRGRRMGGVDKGWVEHRGAPLVQNVLARLRPQVGTVLVSANRSIDRYRGLGCEVLGDGEGDGESNGEGNARGGQGGPLAGMIAVLGALARRGASGPVAFVPCDSPDLPADLVARLAGGAAQGDPQRKGGCAVAVAGGRWQPVVCLLPVGALPALREAFDRGERRPEYLLRALGATPVVFADAAAFANVNTPADCK
jgi:molybdopterin-guanine dinucleotide biosynthesis protein A